MDALLSAFLACLLCEVGGANQRLTLALARRFERDGPVILGIACAAAANATVSAAGGWFLSKLIAADARSLFLGASLFLAGAGLMIQVKEPNPLAGWRSGAFMTTILGLFILGFGDGAQFVIAGIATRTADPVMAAIGGTLGVFAACLPIAILRQPLPSTAKAATMIRWAGGGILMVLGAVLGLTATQLL